MIIIKLYNIKEEFNESSIPRQEHDTATPSHAQQGRSTVHQF